MLKKLFIIGAALLCGQAYACPNDQYEVCFIACFCVPNSGAVAGAVVHPVQEAATQVAAPILKNLILESRDNALRDGVSPIPAQIRANLIGYYPADILDRARYRVRGGGSLALQAGALTYGGQAAITLDYIIVFANEWEALGNPKLWAHELRHVQQVVEWGLDSFAVKYARDYRAVEAEAEAKEAQYPVWAQQQTAKARPSTTQAAAKSRSPMSVSSAAPALADSRNMTNRCGTPVFWCSTQASFAKGVACSCPMAGGWVSGTAF